MALVNANPHEQGYKKHGFIGRTSPAMRRAPRGRAASIRARASRVGSDPAHGKMDVLGGDWQNAVYRVVLSDGKAELAQDGGGQARAQA